MKLFERDVLLSKFGPIALATVLILLTGLSYAADKIALVCSGTLWAKGAGEGPPPTQSVVIDLDRGVVTSSLGDFSIINITENQIRFRGATTNGDTSAGNVDRYSGLVAVSTFHNKEIIANYQLNCQRTVGRLF